MWLEWLPDNWWEILIRLGLALVLSGFIGAERAHTNHDAGLRTHILVCLGATGIMIMSEALHIQFNADVARIGAQVVSGIGFLGAGCILIGGNRIRGLTTAAGLWATACIGLCLGIGYYFVAIAMALIIVLAMIVLHPLSIKFQQKSTAGTHILKIGFANREAMQDILGGMGNYTIAKITYENDLCTVKLVDCTKEDLDDALAKIAGHENIQSVEIVK